MRSTKVYVGEFDAAEQNEILKGDIQSLLDKINTSGYEPVEVFMFQLDQGISRFSRPFKFIVIAKKQN